VFFTSVTLVGVTTGGDSPSTSSSVNYFSSGSLTISGLSGDCNLRLRAAEKTAPSTPGTFSAWYSGKLDEDDDKLLEAYGHHWYLATATSVTYSSLPDGYYLFTASCGTPYTDSNDYFFKVGAYPTHNVGFFDQVKKKVSSPVHSTKQTPICSPLPHKWS